MINIIKSNNEIISNTNLIDTLLELGVKENDTICVHSELFTLGKFILGTNDFLQTLVDCFYEVIGPQGTLIMPTYTYSFCRNQVFNKKESKSTMGILTEYFRKLDNVKRTNDPIFSFAVAGHGKDQYLNDCKTCFDTGSVYDVLQRNNGKIILLGTNMRGYTFSHYTEEVAKVPYRYYKTFSGEIVYEDGQSANKSIDYYVRVLEGRSDLSVEKQKDVLKNSNNYKELPFANSCIVYMDAKQYLEANLKAIEQDSFALIK